MGDGGGNYFSHRSIRIRVISFLPVMAETKQLNKQRDKPESFAAVLSLADRWLTYYVGDQSLSRD